MRWLATVLVAGFALLAASAASAAAQPREDDQPPPTEDQAGLDGSEALLDGAEATETLDHRQCLQLRDEWRIIHGPLYANDPGMRGQVAEAEARLRRRFALCPAGSIPSEDWRRRARQVADQANGGEVASADQGADDHDSGDQATEDPGR